MHRAARIVENMHTAILETIRPGLRKNELVAEIFRTGIWGGEDENGRFGGDYTAIVPLLPTLIGSVEVRAAAADAITIGDGR